MKHSNSFWLACTVTALLTKSQPPYRPKAKKCIRCGSPNLSLGRTMIMAPYLSEPVLLYQSQLSSSIHLP